MKLISVLKFFKLVRLNSKIKLNKFFLKCFESYTILRGSKYEQTSKIQIQKMLQMHLTLLYSFKKYARLGIPKSSIIINTQPFISK